MGDAWMEERLQESAGIVYCLSQDLLRDAKSLNRLLGLTQSQLQSEREFSSKCRDTGAIGLYGEQYLSYRWLSPRIPPVSTDVLRKLGWSEESIDNYIDELPRMDSRDDRMKASVGRRIAMPQFVEDRDHVKEKWLRLAEHNRPGLPLTRPLTCPELPSSVERTPLTAAAKRFAESFAKFCDQWELVGMATWDLPEPRGPFWPNHWNDTDSGSTVISTPKFFAVTSQDRLGQYAAEVHESQSREIGIDDHSHWKTYSHFLDIHFWEMVLRSRYVANVRSTSFVTDLEYVLAGLIGVDVARLQKLRKWLSALQGGRRQSLQGLR